MIKTYANVYLSVKGLWTIALIVCKEMFWIYTIVQKFGIMSFFMYINLHFYSAKLQITNIFMQITKQSITFLKSDIMLQNNFWTF